MAERLRALALALLWLAAWCAHALDCTPLVEASPAPPPVTEFARGLLWRVTAADGAGGYVLGTMHVGDPRVQDVITRSATAFTASRRFVLEVDLDATATEHLQQAMFYQDGRRLADLAGKDLADAAAARLTDYGIPAELAGLMKPWAAFTTLSMPRGDNALPLDLQLLARARTQHKEVAALETVDEQLGLFERMSDTRQVALLRETVCNYAPLQDELERMVGAYVDGDLAGLMATSQRYASADQDALLDELLWKRNERMVERLPALFAGGATFVAVGALHLPGPRGLLALLTRRGYTVEAIY